LVATFMTVSKMGQLVTVRGQQAYPIQKSVNYKEAKKQTHYSAKILRMESLSTHFDTPRARNQQLANIPYQPIPGWFGLHRKWVEHNKTSEA
jgi:hypothetical protein